MSFDFSAIGLASDANTTLSPPEHVGIWSPIGADLTPGQTGLDSNFPGSSSTSNPNSSTSWSSLDNLGSGVTNVGSNILSAFGNLVTAQVNKTALLTATGKGGAAVSRLPTASPNSWGMYVLIALGIAGVGAVVYAVRK